MGPLLGDHCRISVDFKSVHGVEGQEFSISLETSGSKDLPHTLSQSRVQELLFGVGRWVWGEDDKLTMAVVASEQFMI